MITVNLEFVSSTASLLFVSAFIAKQSNHNCVLGRVEQLCQIETRDPARLRVHISGIDEKDLEQRQTPF